MVAIQIEHGHSSKLLGKITTIYSFTFFYYIFSSSRRLVDKDCFPYVGHNSSCTIRRRGPLLEAGCRQPSYEGRKARYDVGPAYRLGNETDIMYEILTSGPVQGKQKAFFRVIRSVHSQIFRNTDNVFFSNNTSPDLRFFRTKMETSQWRLLSTVLSAR